MEYPPYLLPKPDFIIMPYEAWMGAHYLQHHTNDKDLKDPETDLLKLDYIVIVTDHLRDFSTNFIGTFQPEDCLWKVRNERMNEYFGVAWEEGESVETLSPDDCEYHEERGAFYLPIEKCAGNRVEASGATSIIVICDVLHTPIRCNYWHFSLRWKDENGAYYSDLKPKPIRNFFRSWVRKFIQDNAKFDTPDCQSVPVERYQKK